MAAPTLPGNRAIGVDTSHFQSDKGQIDWVKVKASGIQFAFVKATEGSGHVDRDFHDDWPAIYKAGILIRGAYHYGIISGDPIAQANHFITTVRAAGKIGPGDFLILDAEDVYSYSRHVGPVAASKWVTSFLDEVVRLTGLPRKRVLVYTGAWWWKPRTANYAGPANAGHPLWLSAYVGESRIESQDLPGPWPVWRFWQWTSSGTVPGVNGRIDKNVFNGTYRGLWWLSGRPLKRFPRK